MQYENSFVLADPLQETKGPWRSLDHTYRIAKEMLLSHNKENTNWVLSVFWITILSILPIFNVSSDKHFDVGYNCYNSCFIDKEIEALQLTYWRPHSLQGQRQDSGSGCLCFVTWHRFTILLLVRGSCLPRASPWRALWVRW